MLSCSLFKAASTPKIHCSEFIYFFHSYFTSSVAFRAVSLLAGVH
jgi:hypothetical protein